MRQKRRERFFKICHFLITGRVVLHKKFYKKISSTSYQKWKIFRQKNFFLVKKNEHFLIDLLFSKDNSLGEKRNVFQKHFDRLISIEKVKNYLLIRGEKKR